MKKSILSIASVAIFVALFLLSCKKETAEEPPAPVLQSITISPSEFSISLGRTNVLDITLAPSNYSPTESIVFESSAPDIVSVDNLGQVKALSEGSSTITATLDGKNSSCTINVTPYVEPEKPEKPPIKPTLSLNPANLVLSPGMSLQLRVTVYPSDTDISDLKWSSENPLIASIDDKGLLTCHERGYIHVSARTGSLSARCYVQVK